VQGNDSPDGSEPTHPTEEELIRFNGLIVDSIDIENRAIYDTDKEPYDNFIFRTANKLHIKTRKSTIMRELLIKVGEEFSAELAEESVRNLRNRYVIYDAWNEVTLASDSTLLWKIVTIDEWSFAGGIEVSREGNENLYVVGFDEKNFLGLNQNLSLDYYIKQRDDNYLETSFRDFRFLGNPFSFSTIYRGNPKSELRLASVRKPFYSLTQKNSFGFEIADASVLNETFNNSILIGSSRSKSDLFSSYLSHRFGERSKNLVGSIGYDYNYERTGGKIVHSNLSEDSVLAIASFPIDSLYHQLEFSLRIFKVDFTTSRKIDGFGYTEDFTLGHTAAIGLARAFNPQFDDHVYDRLSFDYSFGHSFGKEIVYLSIFRSNKFKGSKEYQKITSISTNYYHHGPDFLTVAFRSKFLGDWERDGAQYLILGGGSGIRGYPSEFRTGEKMAITSLEWRVNPDILLFSAILGFAAFVDAGRTWRRGESFNLKDYYFSGGAGLRLALDRSTKSRFFRLDLAYSNETKWQLSISTGQYFSYAEHRLFLTSR
jgi:outer membrane protein assembly factor BamA